MVFRKMKTAWYLVVMVGRQQLSQDAGIRWLFIRQPRGPSALLMETKAVSGEHWDSSTSQGWVADALLNRALWFFRLG